MEDTIVYAINAARQAALVSIIATSGSTPRKAGAMMLVYPDGRVIGTIGGGCAEAEARLTALDGGRSFLYKLFMSGETAANEGMVCGAWKSLFRLCSTVR
ncbi:XdhC family protein [Sporomusa acidovorans]|uniref:XdhC- CoxI domain-containing protein n=1 Tax=Sporomusa acidovorans (strain ATCC 49682 / DSM 3132 / Mol) TaxID=1123286 RepID=A0ABZ3J8H3_SPOA4|nr:XdhC family protein [Sporomusa acidovorans]OZC16077.1 putative xanthine dehydrogenase subunit A [Sporomusa acidovorans DSM 3132]SDD87455.1 XdhC and CoxI family protein [Sporomusa acidovorans]